MFTSATYNCAGQREVNVFARRFTRSPRNCLFVHTCKSVGLVPAATAPAPPVPPGAGIAIGPAERASIASEIACIALRHHEGGGAQLVDNELLSATLGARRRFITAVAPGRG